MRTNISGIEVEGTPEEIGTLLRSYLAKQTGGAVSVAKPSRNGTRMACDQCGKDFKTKDSLNHHVRKQHGGRTAKGPTSCPDCGKTFSTTQGMKHHQTVTHGTRREISSAAGPSSNIPDISTTDKHYVFVCKVGPTEVRHEVSGKDPSDAIATHDRDHPNHRFVTALNKKEGA